MTGVHDNSPSAAETGLTPHHGSLLSGPSRVAPTTRLLVVGRIGSERYAWPAAAVERVLPMAAVTRVADLPASVAGLIDLHGDTLAVVDPRSRLGLPAQTARPEHHLLLLTATGRYLLWVDCIETIVAVDASTIEAVLDEADDGYTSAPFITRIDGQLVPVLSPAAFDPGRVVQAATGPR